MPGAMTRNLSRRLSTPVVGACFLYLLAIAIDSMAIGSLMVASISGCTILVSALSIVRLRRTSIGSHDDAEWLIGTMKRWLIPVHGIFLPVVVVALFLNPISGAIAALVATFGLLLAIATWLAINSVVTTFYDLRIAAMEAKEDPVE